MRGAAGISAAGGAGFADDRDVLRLVGFRIEDWRFAVRFSQVRTSVLPCAVTRVFLLPSFVRGVINLRGTVVCVLDLGTLLGLDVEAGKMQRLLVVRDGGIEAAIPVNDVFRVPDLAADLVEPVPSGVSSAHREFIEGVVNLSRVPGIDFSSAEATLTLIDVASIFASTPVRALRGMS
jgi:purine-binding chemotaxis protein CheW